MTAPSFTDAALTVGGRIGRNFSIVSMVPTLFLALWAYALFASESWVGAPNLAELRTGFRDLIALAWLIVATLVIALFLHPLQFATVQLLEGYWGSSALALGAMRVRIAHYRDQSHALETRLHHHDGIIDNGFQRHTETRKAGWGGSRNSYLDSSAADGLVPHIVAKDALQASLDKYPERWRMMPTRLGNTLRRIEDLAGSQYGLNMITTAPHFSLVAPESHVAYLRDSRQQLDTTVRLCAVSALATVLTVAALLTDGLWLLVALVPYALTYLAYRAAIAAADEYGTVMSTIIDLDRFTLYESLGLPRPPDTAAERETNRKLMTLLGENDPTVMLTYAPPVTDDAQT